jgi:hypothetical protein
MLLKRAISAVVETRLLGLFIVFTLVNGFLIIQGLLSRDHILIYGLDVFILNYAEVKN